jgi:hypothetical protein
MKPKNISNEAHDHNPWDEALCLLAGIIAEKHLAVMKETPSVNSHTDDADKIAHKNGNDSK